MQDFTNPQRVAGQSQAVAYDEGLRAFMLQVYNYMASGLALTGIVALMSAQSEAIMSMLYVLDEMGRPVGMNPLGWVVALAPLGVVFWLSAKIQTMNFRTAQVWFWGFATLMGLSLASIFLVYTGASIARVFFITAGMFGAMSLWGYTTKKDLTGWGSFLIMGVFGLIIASLVNIFLQSTALHFAVSFIGVFIFVGLIAYDTQRLKNIYYTLGGHGEMIGKAAISGALSLYLDFINLFVMLLRFFGDRR